MKFFSIPTLALGAGLLAYAQAPSAQPGKVAVINIQSAIIGTKDGQKAAAELQTKFAPKQKELERKQGDITALQEQLRKGSNAISETVRLDLTRQIDQKTKSFNREMEDAQAENEQEQQKVLQDLGQRMLQVIEKYSRDNGYSLVLDVSSPQTPVLYASNAIDITQDIVSLYDKSAPAAVGPTTAAPSRPPATGTGVRPQTGSPAANPSRPVTQPPASVKQPPVVPPKKP